jgi:hypothetical protein
MRVVLNFDGVPDPEAVLAGAQIEGDVGLRRETRLQILRPFL